MPGCEVDVWKERSNGMKKMIPFFLVSLLLSSVLSLPQAIAEDASQLYYLWDIPFGISESEFIEQVYAKTGFNFVPHSGVTKDIFWIVTHEEQSISFLGHPLSGAEATFLVDSDGNSSYYSIALFFDVGSETIPRVLSLFDSIRLVLQEKYGDHTFAALYSNKGKLFTCDAIEGGFDIQQVADILTTDDTIDMVMMAWKNLGIGAGKRGYHENIMTLYAATSIAEESGPLEIYENRNKSSDAGL